MLYSLGSYSSTSYLVGSGVKLDVGGGRAEALTSLLPLLVLLVDHLVRAIRDVEFVGVCGDSKCAAWCFMGAI